MSEYEINEYESKDMETESLERLMLKEFKNIIRICDICGEEMLLDDENTFICQGCGYHLKVDTK
ncbi:MAG: hypothetical protein RMJ36_01150 [Candidatus Calescibacterium sp.]|nr:hypothetical protein [Candidatus Calescibacterium sp.]MDW8132247.1 hypothetical protein [Candidatus Calescibacterium sp.]